MMFPVSAYINCSQVLENGSVSCLLMCFFGKTVRLLFGILKAASTVQDFLTGGSKGDLHLCMDAACCAEKRDVAHSAAQGVSNDFIQSQNKTRVYPDSST